MFLKSKSSTTNNLRQNGFTLMELLVVIAIISILASIVFVSMGKAKDKAYYSRAKMEYKSIATALQLYFEDNQDFPPDANRNVPPGLEQYLSTTEGVDQWPTAPWPGSVYDWDNWEDPDNYGENIYQISIRFCPAGGELEECSFPNEDWAENFGVNSAVYYCVSGACRSHINESIDYPGYCVNCEN
jgi:prepilin-type N-terminal cleavage/methylation domain-containing protein